MAVCRVGGGPLSTFKLLTRLTYGARSTDLVISALEMPVFNRRPEPGVVHHSDPGNTALSFGKHLEKSGLLGSMGSIGSALDNAMAESFFASLQTELLDRRILPTPPTEPIMCIYMCQLRDHRRSRDDLR
jgi:transposase InsO family protein